MTNGLIRQGDVFWIGLGPAGSSAPAELHPRVVVQGDRFNRSRMYTTVVCIITSSLARAKDPGNVLWARGEGGLVRASVVNVSQLVTVDKLDLGDRLGRITAGSMKAIREGIHLLVD